MLHIQSSHCGWESEPLSAPFGFKGRQIDVLWQTAVTLTDANGKTGCGCGVQSVVWSDAGLFSHLGQKAGNEAMFRVTRLAAEMVRGQHFRDPMAMMAEILPTLTERVNRTLDFPGLRPTFLLNALVPLDLAAWQLYARNGGIGDFDALLPPEYRSPLSARHDKLANIPLVTYGVSPADTRQLALDGASLIKIKLGSDPDKDGDFQKMLDWDIRRVSQLHEVLKEIDTPYTATGKPAYYFDANGRYDSKDRLLRLVDHLDRIGALAQTVLLEEPFPEGSGIDVSDIPLRIAGDESAHSAKDVMELMDLGYTAMALKPVAKTLSISLEVARCAAKRNVPCFCADLTVHPLLVDWNKNVAARLGEIPGMKIGALESNGPQNYPDWNRLKSYHPLPDATWIVPHNGVYTLDESFYRESGGIFYDSQYYRSLTEKSKIGAARDEGGSGGEHFGV